jgi:hypothetical protein
MYTSDDHFETAHQEILSQFQKAYRDTYDEVYKEVYPEAYKQAVERRC